MPDFLVRSIPGTLPDLQKQRVAKEDQHGKHWSIIWPAALPTSTTAGQGQELTFPSQHSNGKQQLGRAWEETALPRETSC